MANVECGFADVPGGASGSDLLTSYGPTPPVDIGFDANFKANQVPAPIAGIKGVDALVDTGAAESCIDSLLASQLNLPIVDRRPIAGALGQGEANMHLAQVHIPSLKRTIYGVFAGVHLQAGGQMHKALIGRTFLRHCTMSYDGQAGTVSIETPDVPGAAAAPPPPLLPAPAS
jgi:predicted aspartyl protease